MIELTSHGVYLVDGKPQEGAPMSMSPDAARENTIAYSILRAHDVSDDPKKMRIKFDCLVSHDITYVGIIQTARAIATTACAPSAARSTRMTMCLAFLPQRSTAAFMCRQTRASSTAMPARRSLPAAT